MYFQCAKKQKQSSLVLVIDCSSWIDRVCFAYPTKMYINMNEYLYTYTHTHKLFRQYFAMTFDMSKQLVTINSQLAD